MLKLKYLEMAFNNVYITTYTDFRMPAGGGKL